MDCCAEPGGGQAGPEAGRGACARSRCQRCPSRGRGRHRGSPAILVTPVMSSSTAKAIMVLITLVVVVLVVTVEQAGDVLCAYHRGGGQLVVSEEDVILITATSALST